MTSTFLYEDDPELGFAQKPQGAESDRSHPNGTFSLKCWKSVSVSISLDQEQTIVCDNPPPGDFVIDSVSSIMLSMLSVNILIICSLTLPG